MRVYVSKPVDGRVTVRVSDKGGSIGFKAQRATVPVEEFKATVAAMVGAYESQRRAVLDARRPTEV